MRSMYRSILIDTLKVQTFLPLVLQYLDPIGQNKNKDENCT